MIEQPYAKSIPRVFKIGIECAPPSGERRPFQPDDEVERACPCMRQCLGAFPISRSASLPKHLSSLFTTSQSCKALT